MIKVSPGLVTYMEEELGIKLPAPSPEELKAQRQVFLVEPSLAPMPPLRRSFIETLEEVFKGSEADFLKDAEAIMKKRGLSGTSVREIGTTKPVGEVQHVLGSGSALVAFSKHDRRYVGVEHLEVHIEKSDEWVNAHDWWLGR